MIHLHARRSERSHGRRTSPRSHVAVAALGALSLAFAMSGCSDDDDGDDTGSTGATSGRGGSSSAGKSGKAGSSGKGGTSAGNGGSSGKSAGKAGSSGAGSGGDAGGGAEPGKGGEGGEGATPSQGGEGGEPTTGGTAGTSGTSGTGGNNMVDPEQYDGQQVFRYDTFGDEQLWTDTLRLNEAIQAALDPTTALSLGLKVDAAALPDGILETADLTDPATTVALIALNAVVGVQGTVDPEGNLTSVGITCALCHSNVDDSVMAGIGMRIDGAANRDLDPGAIIALSPGLAGNDEALAVYNSWGPGFYDARYNQDGINEPVVIPPIYGLGDVELETYTGDGPVSYWNSYVAVTQMGGQGQFFDPRIDVAVVWENDLVTPKLPALYEYEASLEPPPVPTSAYDADAAERGDALFDGDARCSTCHTGDSYTDANETLHDPDEIGTDPTSAERSATKMYRTTPLRALLAHPPYFHDGSAATLADVVTHYNTQFNLDLTAEEQSDLVEYLKSL